MHNKRHHLPEGFHDLGEELGAAKVEVIQEEAETQIHYPSLWFHDNDGLKKLPSKGYALICYTKVMEREETTTRNDKKEKGYVCELQIHGIKPVDNDEATEVEPDDDDAIEMGLEEASKETKND